MPEKTFLLAGTPQKYIYQIDDYSCGPVAVVNAIKWAGFKAGYEDLSYFRKECRTTEEMGTYPDDLFWTLKKLELQGLFRLVYRIEDADLEDIDECWIPNSAMLITTCTAPAAKGPESCHYSLIVDKQKRKATIYYWLANYYTKRGLAKMSRGFLKQILRKSKKAVSAANLRTDVIVVTK